MGQMTLVRSDGCLSISIEWNDNNSRINGAIIDNQCNRDVLVEVYDVNDVAIFSKTYAHGLYNENIQGNASRYVDVIEVAPGDFEIEVYGFALRAS